MVPAFTPIDYAARVARVAQSVKAAGFDAYIGTRQGSLVALSATGGVITSAGLVLAATFAVLGTIPLVFLAEMGTAVALGVMLDTMIVRSVLVTALNLDLGHRIWWPSKLDRGDDENLQELAQSDEPLPV